MARGAGARLVLRGQREQGKGELGGAHAQKWKEEEKMAAARGGRRQGERLLRVRGRAAVGLNGPHGR
jgi:hypothetical protein